MTVKQPFNPAFTRTREITATTTSAPTTVDATRSFKNLRLVNLSANVIWVRTWDSRNGAAPAAVAAAGGTPGDYPVAPSQSSVITKDEEHDVLCVVAETGSSRLLVSLGEGW